MADAQKTAGVATLEGRIGPLILGEGSQAHFIDMQSGLFVAEHPHSTESLIYTVRGQWVLCSAGRRQLMKAGSLFRFAAGTPTGYEVPFDDPALILIFKGDRITKDEREFIEYSEGHGRPAGKRPRQWHAVFAQGTGGRSPGSRICPASQRRIRHREVRYNRAN